MCLGFGGGIKLNNNMSMKNYILVEILFVVIIIVGYLIYQNFSTPLPVTVTNIQLSEQQPESQTEQSKNEKVYSIIELVNSGLFEGQYIKVRGIVGSCIALKVSADYEGPGTGCYLVSSDSKQSIYIGEFNFLEYKGREVIVGGYVYYCGGGKIPKYICGIKNVEVLKVIQ